MKITPLLIEATAARAAAVEARERAGAMLNRDESRRLLDYALALERRAAELGMIAERAVDDLLTGMGASSAPPERTASAAIVAPSRM